MHTLTRAMANLTAFLALVLPMTAIRAGLQSDDNGFAIMPSGGRLADFFLSRPCQPCEGFWQAVEAMCQCYSNGLRKLTFALPHFDGEDRSVGIVKSSGHYGSDSQFDIAAARAAHPN